MITREKILNFVGTMEKAAYDKPFTDDFDTTILRHTDTKKWFGAIIKAPKSKIGLIGDGTADVINLKCDPTLSQGLKQSYRGIVDGWHMNKYHWISVILDSDVDIITLKELIMLSYSLTSGKNAHKNFEN